MILTRKIISSSVVHSDRLIVKDQILLLIVRLSRNLIEAEEIGRSPIYAFLI